jgi:2-dehydropantoate 2-reductase
MIAKGVGHMNIAILGVGGVGGYFGAKICRAKEALQADVYFVARGAHLKAIQDNGLTVRTSSEGIIHCHPTLATSNIDELPYLDACLICVKSYDLNELTKCLTSRISDGTEIVPLLNGIDIYDRIRKNIPTGYIYPACVFIGTHRDEPGIISQDGGACKVLFGNAPRETTIRTPIMVRVFDASSINSEWHEDISPFLWSKFIFIASFSLVTACFNKTLGQVMESDELSSMVRSIMSEILVLANAKGIRLPASIIENTYQKGNEFPPNTKTSFHRDFESQDRPDERDLFGGGIISLGEQLDIATPHTCELWEIINQKKQLKFQKS